MRRILAGILFIALSFVAVNANAISLSYPDINFDSSSPLPGFGLTYDASTGILDVNALLNKITFADGSVIFPGGVVNYSLKLLYEDNSVLNVTKGNFGTTGSSPDLEIIDGSSTVLLTGNFLSANMTGVNGTNIGSGEATFTVTGGTLSSAFVSVCSGDPNCGGMVSLYFDLSTTFNTGMFSTSFEGETKGDIAPIPEPTTVFLLGSALLGFAVLGTFKKRKRA